MLISDDQQIFDLLSSCKTIAMIGASPKPWRDSHRVMAFLQQQGYRVLPVNPSFAGQSLLGEVVVARLADCAAPVDLVDIFRNSEAAGVAVDEAIAESNRLRLQAVWMQLGVINAAAAERACSAGLQVVMNRCPKIEIPRLGLAALSQTRALQGA
jgi:predicted CoA-binding protein